MEVRTYTEVNRVQIEFEGRRVEITLRNTEDGPLLLLDPMEGCSLEGDEPGSYYLRPANGVLVT